MVQPAHEESPGHGVPVVAGRLREMTEAFYALGQGYAVRHGLHPTDVQALVHLVKADAVGTQVTAGHIGEALGLASGSVTGLVDRLERAGHVHRVRDRRDRRRVIVAPTDAALAAGRDYFGSLDAAVTRALAAYGPDELGTIARFLTEMTAIANDTAGTPDGVPTTAGPVGATGDATTAVDA